MSINQNRTATFRHALVLLLGSCLPVMAAVLIAPVLPQIMQHFASVPNAEVLVPLALTIPALAVGIISPLAGMIVDRFGRKLPVHMGFVLQAIGITSPARIGMATAIGSGATVAGALVFRRLSALGVPLGLAIAFGSLGGGFLAVGAASDFNAVVIGAILNGFGAGLLLPTLLIWLMQQLRFEERGRGVGVFTASFFVGQFVCPLVVLGLNKSLGGLGAALNGMGWIAVGAAIVAMGSAIVLRPGGVANSNT